jgi:protease I
VVLIGPTAGAEFRGKRGDIVVTSDLAAGAARMKDFDALVIPGGHAPDKMRMRHAMVDLTREAMDAAKPVAAICHGPQLLISANALRGRTLTCWPSIAIDVKNAGGLYVDKPVVEDGNLITSRKPDDVPAFSEAIIRAIARVHRP